MNYVNLKIDKKKNIKKTSFSKYMIIILITFIFAGGGMVLAKKSKQWFNPISIIATVASVNLKETDGRTNILILGSDKRTVGNITSELTDTLLVASIGRVENDVVLISLPRDLWVEDSRGAKSKINAVYTINKQDESDNISGGNATMGVVEKVLGVPVHYYLVLNFELFKEAVDTLGGVDIQVDKSFIDYYYPIEGKENSFPESERYEILKFEAGPQTMNGETALKYVRSRQGTNGEDTDFARSERQQKVIAAIKNKALSLNTLINPKKIKDLYDLYAANVDTNINFNDVQDFYLLSQQINFDKIISIVLDDRSAADEGGLLYAPEDKQLYGGAYVLIPKTGNFSQLHAYVQRYLFSK
ncbi:hypothetical protein A2V49_02530 [candidate division WWE3 bacterium RBG_19FT_COMBO_34_6]|uniref:Cell envelope-related transcriptional attenuator domain-containing protein n=1 Tax=candidate division WWE3 bacterium RBG_19FT_COMBO_34_6 TaxID=1802612 RepID=A0A1F4ULQ8_UNCKA|nr:MAG: hypothetical protein A2V49_02530 [candidate division WWE3 bacterium RBG_19FT_COMBO_34_6]